MLQVCSAMGSLYATYDVPPPAQSFGRVQVLCGREVVVCGAIGPCCVAAQGRAQGRGNFRSAMVLVLLSYGSCTHFLLQQANSAPE